MNIISKIRQDSFLRHSAVFFIGSMFVAFFNYLFYPVLGRIMSVNDFGEVQTLISIQAQISIILATFGVVITNITVNYQNERDENIITDLRRLLLVLMIIGGMMIIVFRHQLEFFFHIENGIIFTSFAAIFPISALFVVRNAYLQGKRKFASVSVAGMITSAGRLVLSFLFVFIGYKAAGVMVGILLAQFIAFIYVYQLTKNELAPRFGWKLSGLKNKEVQNELWYGLLIMIATGVITFLSTADIIVVKHYFSADIAGMYSGVSVIAKIIFFISGPINGVMFSSIKLKGEYEANFKLLKKAFYLILVIGLMSLLTFYLFYANIINLLMGPKYVPMSQILVHLSVVAFIVSLASLLMNYYLALRCRWLYVIAIVGVLITTVSSVIYNDNLEQIINCFLAGSSFVLLALMTMLYVDNQKNIKSKN